MIQWIALAALAGITVWGLVSARLFEQTIWSPLGVRRLGLFAAAAAVCWIVRPRWFGRLALAVGLGWTVAATGVLPLAAVALFLLSCLAVGRWFVRDDDLLALVLGLATWIFVIGIAVHIPVNYPAVYLVAFVAPVGLQLGTGRRPVLTVPPVAAVVLLVHLLFVLKPEVSADGLAMHLAAPAQIALQHYWAFDVRQFTWAVMPMGADWCYAAVYLLGGEYAARLLNFAMLLVLAALAYRLARNWFAVALFASSPVVQLVTGSLFVENFQAALLIGAVAAILEYRPWVAAALLGAGIAVKLGALAFAIAAGALLAYECRRKRAKWKTGLAALALCLLFAAPPYLFAYAATGNPVFPFLNAVFRSPLYDTDKSFVNTRMQSRAGWDLLYELTFHTDRYLESLNGAFGFHYLLLLPLSAIALGRRWPRAAGAALFVAIAFSAIILATQPNLRYLYPALPLLVAPIGAALERNGRWLYVAGAAALALNIWFLPASGWNHREFFLNPFDRGDAERYVKDHAPVRKLIEYLNQHYPGEPVAFFETTQVAGLRARAYMNSWHNKEFLRRLSVSGSAGECFELAKSLGIRWFVVGRFVSYAPAERFLDEYTGPEYEWGGWSVRRLRDAWAPRPGAVPLAAGEHDDASGGIRYEGPWRHDNQFREPAGGSLTYADAAGATAIFTFSGTEFVWVYTKAVNRGLAEVTIDGVARGTIDLYSRAPVWRAQTAFGGLAPGKHSVAIRVLGRKNPASEGTYVDVDAIGVR